MRYHESDHGSASAGLIRKCPDGSFDMIVNQHLSPEQKFATIAHELGHLYCGHLGPEDARWWPCRTGLPHIVEEFEAESVAWLVCKRAGIRPCSDKYLGHLSMFDEMPAINLELVLIAAGLIESMAERSLGKRKDKKHGRSYSNRSRFTASWDSMRLWWGRILFAPAYSAGGMMGVSPAPFPPSHPIPLALDRRERFGL